MKKKLAAAIALIAILIVAAACESTHRTCPAYRGSVVENVQQ